jgi:hydrogenase maturation factor
VRALVLAILVACGGTSRSVVGPYVKHVQRNGDWLLVHRCMIVLEDKDLSETACRVEYVPLAQVPQQLPPR